MAVIKETFLLAASDADVLDAPSRLAAIPYAGIMTIEAAATDCDATNQGTLTLQLPNGDNPLDGVLVPANGMSTADGVLKTDTELLIQFPVEAGGHVLLAYTETGTVALCFIMVTLQFERLRSGGVAAGF